jgi:putative DNA primase/helicase
VRPEPSLLAGQGLPAPRERGRFVQPASGKDAVRDVVELSSPVTAFVGECCALGPGLEVSRRWLFEQWRRWCQDQGHPEGSSGTFGRNLKAAFPGLGESRPRETPARDRHYTGIALKGAGTAGHGVDLLP